MPKDEYYITVRFQRSLSDDANVIGKEPGAVTDAELTKQFVLELQEHYDNSGMAGLFDVTKLER